MAVFVQVPACARYPADCGVGVEQGAGLAGCPAAPGKAECGFATAAVNG
jgi:hypothetical protein